MLYCLFVVAIPLFAQDSKPLDSLFTGGSASLNARELSLAGQQYSEGLSLALENGDSLYIGRFYYGLGSVAFYQNQPEQAVENILTGLDWLNTKKHPEDAAKARSNLGGIYASLKEYEKAAQYFEKALSLSGEDTQPRLHLLINLSALYLDTKDYSRSLSLSEDALALADKLGQPMMRAVTLTNMGKAYQELEQWGKSIRVGKESLRIRDSIGQGSPVVTLNNLGYSWHKSGRPDKAEPYYHQALESASGEQRAQVLLNLANLKRETGDLAASIEWFDAYNTLKDSLNEQDYRTRAAELSEKYESDKKQFQIETLEGEKALQEQRIARQRILVGAVVTLLALFSVLVIVWVRQNRTRQALERSRMQQRFLRAQLNPHFIFNALQSVQHFIHKNDTEASQEYLGSFGGLIRNVLEYSDRDTIPLSEEIKMLRDYLQLQQLNHGHSFSWEVTTDGIDSPEDVRLPVMLVQPFVENAVIHGVKGVKGAEVKISFKAYSTASPQAGADKPSMLEVTVSDIGRGLGNAQSRADGMHRSMGRDITDQRIREYNRQQQKKISIMVSAHQEDTERPGTKVVLWIPT